LDAMSTRQTPMPAAWTAIFNCSWAASTLARNASSCSALASSDEFGRVMLQGGRARESESLLTGSVRHGQTYSEGLVRDGNHEWVAVGNVWIHPGLFKLLVRGSVSRSKGVLPWVSIPAAHLCSSAVFLVRTEGNKGNKETLNGLLRFLPFHSSADYSFANFEK